MGCYTYLQARHGALHTALAMAVLLSPAGALPGTTHLDVIAVIPPVATNPFPYVWESVPFGKGFRAPWPNLEALCSPGTQQGNGGTDGRLQNSYYYKVVARLNSFALQATGWATVTAATCSSNDVRDSSSPDTVLALISCPAATDPTQVDVIEPELIESAACQCFANNDVVDGGHPSLLQSVANQWVTLQCAKDCWPDYPNPTNPKQDFCYGSFARLPLDPSRRYWVVVMLFIQGPEELLQTAPITIAGVASPSPPPAPPPPPPPPDPILPQKLRPPPPPTIIKPKKPAQSGLPQLKKLGKTQAQATLRVEPAAGAIMYQAKCFPAGKPLQLVKNSNIRIAKTAAAVVFTMGKLKPNTVYKCAITARNPAGTSPALLVSFKTKK